MEAPVEPKPPSQLIGRRFGIRTWAILLVLAADLPLLIFGWATVRWAARRHEATFTRSQEDTVRVLASAIDGELHALKAALLALAASDTLQQGNLKAFFAEARQVAAQNDIWIVLTDASGQMVLNTRRPHGAPLPMTNGREVVRAVLKGGQPVVSGMIFGPVVQRWIVAVAVPVFRDGKAVAMLGATFFPDRFSRLLAKQELGQAWRVTILDSLSRTVTRLPLAEERAGKPALAWVEAMLRSGNQGSGAGILVDGVPGRVAFHRLSEAPWVLTLSIPLAALPWARPVYWFTVLGLLLGVGAAAAALYASRQLTRPVAALAARAERLLQGETIAVEPGSGIREIHQLEEALVAATANLQALHQEQARIAVAEVRARTEAEAAAALRIEVAQRQHAEEALREHTRVLDLAQVLIRDVASRIIFWNTGAERLYGYMAAEAVGRLSHELLQTVFPESREAVDAVLASTGEWDGELVHTAKDGRRIIVASHQVLHRDAAGAPKAILEVNNDITARKRAEERLAAEEELLRAILEQAAEEIVVRDAQGRLLLANAEVRRSLHPIPAGSAVLEGTSLDTVPKLWGDMLDPKGQPIPLEAYPIARALKGERVLPMEFCRLAPDGRMRTLLNTASPLRDTRGTIIGAVAISTEITTQKQKEAELRQAQAELEQRVQERTAELAQSVRTLTAETARRAVAEETLWQRSLQLRALTAELTLAEQRERRRLAEVLHDDLQQLLVGAKLQLAELQRMPNAGMGQRAGDVGGLIQQALEVSRSLTRELSPPILHEGGLIPALDWLGRWMQDRHGLQVEVAAAGNVPALSDDAKVLLFQTVRELLFNVVKHAHVSRAAVEVSGLGEDIRIVVRDEGRGFDPAALLVEGGRAGGFGLFSIRERLELLGGRLEIESAAEKGSRVTLLVPSGSLVPAPPAASLSASPRPLPEKRLPGEGNAIRILVVDDHVIVRQGLVRLLAAERDLEVIGEASDGKEALLLTQELRPQVVVMDVGMREMNGIEATRVIHAEWPEVQVIGLSMYDEAEKGQAMREAGAVHYLSKLGPSERLLAAIRGCVRA